MPEYTATRTIPAQSTQEDVHDLTVEIRDELQAAAAADDVQLGPEFTLHLGPVNRSNHEQVLTGTAVTIEEPVRG